MDTPPPLPAPAKQRTLDELDELVAQARRQGRTVVWTNGCFEILHAGHIEFLLKAARLGDLLIVGVNSDASVARLKGVGHPVTPEGERLTVLSAVACVDYLMRFDADTCEMPLERLRPEVYAKGLEHLHGGINEAERAIVERNGGTVALIGGDPAKSTRAIIERIRDDGR